MPEHLAARVEPDKKRAPMLCEHAPGGLAGTRPKLKDAGCMNAGSGARHLLQALVLGNRFALNWR